MRARLAGLVGGAVLAAVVAAFSAYLWFDRAIVAPGPLARAVTVIVTPGSGLNAIAAQLESAGVIDKPLLFRLQARLSGQARFLKAGEYNFLPGTSIVAALDKIVRHDVVSRFVTIPEGLTTAEALRIVTGTDGLNGQITLAVGEGELLPETYRYTWGDSRDGLVAEMRAARDDVLQSLWESRAENLPFDTPDEAAILASIVEKETGLAAERKRVAAVFVNRLRRGMRLQSDPTVIYGLNSENGAIGRRLTRADLEAPSDYNTYVIDGLPPGPICNPGRAALEAVLHPAETDDLYFVADGTGGHAFAPSLAEHNRNVARWRRIQREDR